MGHLNIISNLFIATTNLAILAVGIYLVVITQDDTLKKDRNDDLNNLLLALGSAFIIFGSGRVIDIVHQLFFVKSSEEIEKIKIPEGGYLSRLRKL